MPGQHEFEGSFMANNTTFPSKVDSCRDTKIFGEITPDIFQAILDSIPAICRAVLNWEPLAVWFLEQIIRQISTSGEILYLGHLEFGRILFDADSSEFALRKRIGRANKSVKRCQLLSGFKAVDIQTGEMIENHGKKEYFPTTYQLKDFFIVFLEFRDLAREQNLMSLKQRERKITQFAIAKSICDARGYAEIPKRERVKIENTEKSDKEKSTSPPCRCDCSSCVHCAAKGATGGESTGVYRCTSCGNTESREREVICWKCGKGEMVYVRPAESARRVEELRRQPNEDFTVDIEAFADRFERQLAEQGLGKEFIYTIKRVYHALEIAEQSARDLIVRSKTGGRLKLVGGQPK